MGALGEERGTIVGHSLGGGVALQFAYQFPERCERLVLYRAAVSVASFTHCSERRRSPGPEVVLPWLCVAGRHSVGAVAHVLGRIGLRASADLEEIWRNFVSLEEPDARQAFLHTVRSIIDVGGQRVSATNRLYLASALPTLIVWGERDPLIPVHHAHAAHQKIQGSRLEIFPAAGHFPYRDDARRFAAVLLEFLQETAPMPVDEQHWRRQLQTAGQSTRRAEARRAAARLETEVSARARAKDCWGGLQ